MKKLLAVFCMVILTFTACIFQSEDIAELSETGVQEIKAEESKERESGIAEPEAERAQVTNQDADKDSVHTDNDSTADVQNAIRSEEEDIQAQELYESFVNQEYAGLENYAYVVYDADGDGCRELYIKRGSSQSFYMVTYVNGGLLIEYQKEISRVVRRQQWIDMETLTSAQDEEMVHSGIYVYAEQDDESENFWYPNENDFVAANGFEGVEPFFEYSIPDGTKRLTFYYDEATQKGCGIRYYQRDPSTFTTTGMYGFVFEGVRESGGSGILEDYLEPLACNGKRGSDYASDCKENMEYDDVGRLTHYDVSGLSYLKDRDTESEPFLWIDYEYYGNGNLKSRFYWHSGYVFGSSYSTWQCYFDEQGRIAYEDIYITHGSEDTYYIYMDDTNEPAYILDLDNNMGWWMPEFRKKI